MRIAIVSGGTGGHLFPGIAVAEELGKDGECQIHFFVDPGRGSEEILERAHFSYSLLAAGPLRGKSLWVIPISLLKSLAGFFQSLALLIGERPAVVLGLGGYASGPFVLAAALLGIPCLIQEQNLKPGLTNRLLSHFVREVATSFQETAEHFPKGKAVHTGNPVRSDILSARREEAAGRLGLETNRPTLSVIGGSQGASHLNRVMAEAAPRLAERLSGLQVIHHAGKRDCEAQKEAYARTKLRALVFPFLSRIGDVYAVTDLVISRAGGGVVAELTARGVPAILVPFPGAAGGHQEENARWLEAKGGATVVLDAELTVETLTGLVEEILGKEDRLAALSRASLACGRPGASRFLADRVKRIARGEGGPG